LVGIKTISFLRHTRTIREYAQGDGGEVRGAVRHETKITKSDMRMHIIEKKGVMLTWATTNESSKKGGASAWPTLKTTFSSRGEKKERRERGLRQRESLPSR